MTYSPPPLSKVRRVGNLLFLSGQLPRGSDGEIVEGDIKDQTRQALANIEAVLASEGSSLKDVVKMTAWLTDTRHLAGFNEVYRSAFSEPYPARSAVISGLTAGDVELEAIAVVP